MWFEQLTGFAENNPQQVRENLTVGCQMLRSRVNGKAFVCGQLETPSLAELLQRVRSAEAKGGPTTLREVVANVQHLHCDPANGGSLFQVASQFNLLEMISPHVTPEQGVGIYENDPTQGPACAIAAGAGTIYRNYFAQVNGQVGQSADQPDRLSGRSGRRLGNRESRLWEMRNGYTLATQSGLAEIDQRLRDASEGERDSLRQLLRIGIQYSALDVAVVSYGSSKPRVRELVSQF